MDGDGIVGQTVGGMMRESRRMPRNNLGMDLNGAGEETMLRTWEEIPAATLALANITASQVVVKYL